MPTHKVSTGNPEMDKDIELLYSICESPEKLKGVKDAILNRSISEDEFKKTVPEGVVRLAFLLTGMIYAINLDSRASAEAKATLEEAHKLVDKHFREVIYNPTAVKVMKKFFEGEGESPRETLRGDCVNSITSATSMTIWDGIPPKLIPSARIGFRNPKGKIVLDSMLGTCELSNLLEKVSSILSNLLDEGKILAEKELINLSVFDGFAEDIKATECNIKAIRETAASYQISFTDNSTESEGSRS